MNTYPDAIFIGAINYDYIFQGEKKGDGFHILENGREKLNWDKNNGKFDDKIQELYENYNIRRNSLEDRHT